MNMHQIPDQNNGPLILISGSAPLARFFSVGLISYSTKTCQHSELVTIARDTNPSLILMELNAQDDLLFQQLREAMPDCPILVVTERAQDEHFQNTIDAKAIISWPCCDINTAYEKVNALIGHLNPRLRQPRRGFLYRKDNRPSELSDTISQPKVAH